MKATHRTQFPNVVPRLALVVWVISAGLQFGQALAIENYPSKTISMVVPWPPGGATDANARLIAQAMSKDLGQPIIIDNKSGAGGSIGGGYAARSTPDGYTLVYIASSNVITSLLIKNPSYGSGEDLVPVALTVNEPLLLLINPDKNISSIADLATLARSTPDGLTYATTGPGGILHLAAADLLSGLNIKSTPVPYRGTAPALTDLLGGQVQMFFGTFSDAYPLVLSGKLKALAITASKRSPLLPDVPTLSEATGRDNQERGTWQGILVPKSTPPEIIARLQKSVDAAVDDGSVKDRLIGKGLEPLGGSPADFDARIKSELEKRGPALKRLGITAF